jgi:hypothetical protein
MPERWPVWTGVRRMRIRWAYVSLGNATIPRIFCPILVLVVGDSDVYIDPGKVVEIQLSMTPDGCNAFTNADFDDQSGPWLLIRHKFDLLTVI